MSASIVCQLILKDLYLMRPMMIGALVIGAIGIVLLPAGEAAFNVGWIVLFIAVVLLGVFTTVVGVTGERKEKVHLFVLTLPTSPKQYTAAKLGASAIAFLGPWSILAAAALAVAAFTPIPDRLMAFLAILLLYGVCYYAAYLAVALVSDSMILSTVVVIIGNTAPAFFIPALFRMPEITADPAASGPIWTSNVLAIIAVEIAFSVGAVGLAVYARSRQRDLI